MKNLVLVLALSLLIGSCNNEPSTKTNSTPATDVSAQVSDSAAAPDAPVISFEKSEFDFGSVNAGQKVNYQYKFSNTGKTPLIISSATASCGCTIPDYPKEPIAPGGNGVIKVVFDSTGKFGKQSKAITITSNANPPTATVYLNGEVKEPKQTK